MNLKSSLLAVAVAALSLATSAAEPSTKSAEPRGGRVGWARLVTPNTAWNRHADADPTLTQFIRRETSLNIDPTWYSADPASVEQLCSYPLLFTNNLTDVKDPAHWKNLTEYLQRGGFLFIDSCINLGITPDPDRFLERHIALMKTIAPKAVVRELPKNHEIYRNYFVMSETPPHTFHQNVFRKNWAKHGLYGVFEGDRMISLIDLSGLQCGWAGTHTRPHAEQCMKMVVNIYVYTMTR
ncbi:MAG TPA: DUF4159 domain-containing protein [Opitutaceae bacterium]|nr:DUF4159 domain-containing protein [Opitutaceae bacterium]